MDEKELTLEELTPLDLRRCQTVDEIVQDMERCSLGARMLGEVASTLYGMIDHGEKPLIVYDGKPDTPLGKLLQQMVVDKKWFSGIVLPEDYAGGRVHAQNILVVGGYSERHEDALYKKPDRHLFINEEGRAAPDQVKDGHFPDVVFSDPCYVMPVLFHSLQERLEGTRTSVDDLFKNLRQYGGLAHEVARGASTLQEMVADKECTVFLTLSGVMTIAQMGLVICDLIDEGFVHYIASTGALMAHGLVEGVGLKHYKYDPRLSDTFLAAKRLNRVTDTLEPETNFDHIEDVLNEVLDKISGKREIAPRTFHQMIGEHLARKYSDQRGILRSAYEKGVPVITPAFVDSEIGNDVFVYNRKRKMQHRRKITINPELDSEDLVKALLRAKKLAIFTIGGGVPRNNVQNGAPLIEIMNERLRLGLNPPRFSRGVRVAPDNLYVGHLTGCTYSEGESWRKFVAGARTAEVKAEATLVLPFYGKHLLDIREAA